MATSKRPRPCHRAFLEHIEELELAVADPGGLAVQLYSKGLIDQVTRQRASLTSVTQLERTRELLQKLEDKIKSDDAIFNIFLSILAPNPTMEDICTKLRATRGIINYLANVTSGYISTTPHFR